MASSSKSRIEIDVTKWPELRDLTKRENRWQRGRARNILKQSRYVTEPDDTENQSNLVLGGIESRYLVGKRSVEGSQCIILAEKKLSSNKGHWEVALRSTSTNDKVSRTYARFRTRRRQFRLRRSKSSALSKCISPSPVPPMEPTPSSPNSNASTLHTMMPRKCLTANQLPVTRTSVHEHNFSAYEASMTEKVFCSGH